MKTLGREFIGSGEVAGIRFKQLFRYNELCLFERGDMSYEVIRLRYQKEKTSTIGGKQIKFEEKEVYPSKEAWNGWACHTLEKAVRMFNEEAKVSKYRIFLTQDMLTDETERNATAANETGDQPESAEDNPDGICNGEDSLP